MTLGDRAPPWWCATRVPRSKWRWRNSSDASLHKPSYRAELPAHPDAIGLPLAQVEAGFVRVAASTHLSVPG